MDGTTQQLHDETARWTQRLDKAIERSRALTPRGEDFFENIRAYRADAVHFGSIGDAVRAFECVVWGWAWLEIGASIGDIEWLDDDRSNRREA